MHACLRFIEVEESSDEDVFDWVGNKQLIMGFMYIRALTFHLFC